MGKQKRSENTYQKINTIFKRDEFNVIMPYDGFVDPTLEWLKNCKFECSEKVDGTNIRIEVKTEFIVLENESVPSGVTFNIAYKGKTDNANLPKKLLEFMTQTYTKEKILYALGLEEKIMFSDFEKHNWGTLDEKTGIFTPGLEFVPKMWTIYGEGYGAGIQGCGGNYLKNSVKVIGFDVKVTPNTGVELYLLKDTRDDVLNKLGMPIVPTIGYFTIEEAIEYVKKGFKSTVAENNKEFLAEGLVCKCPYDILDRRGRRIVFKVKTCDFVKYYNKYGTYDKVEQHVKQID